jgi:plasmid stability protein
MPKTLTLHEVPDELHAKLKGRAQEHQRSLESEILHILQDATDETEIDRDALWERIQKRRKNLPPMPWGPRELKQKMREGLA